MKKTVYFRAFEEEDAPNIYEWTNNDELKTLSIGLNRRICKDEALEWVKARMRHNPYQAWWAICAVDSNKMIGYMSLTDVHYINSSANFSGIVIGDKDYQDGFAWIETYLFVYEYAFERLGLNRVYGETIIEHDTSQMMRKLMYTTTEGLKRQAVYKNGRFYDVTISSLLREEYYDHKKKGDYEILAILKHLRKIKKEKK